MKKPANGGQAKCLPQIEFGLSSLPRREFFKSALMMMMLGSSGLTGCGWFRRKDATNRDLSYLSAPDGFSYFVSPHYCNARPRRVLLLAPNCVVQPLELQRQFIEVLANQLRQAQLFEVLVDHKQDGCNCDLDAILHGQFNERHLLDLTAKYNADAIMLARVNRFDTNSPMQMSVTCVLIDRAESIVLFAADGTWDTSEPELAAAYRSFSKDQSQKFSQAFDNITLQSPRQLQRYISWQIARLLVGKTS